MSKPRLFAWVAAMVVCAAAVPRGAELLGLDLAGRAWNAQRWSAPYLALTGELLGGVIGGALIGFAQALIARQPRLRWMAASALGGLFVSAAYSAWAPVAVVAAPVAAALASVLQIRRALYVRSQAVAAAWVAMALALPFPPWAAALFLLGAALVSGFGIRAAV